MNPVSADSVLHASERQWYDNTGRQEFPISSPHIQSRSHVYHNVNIGDNAAAVVGNVYYSGVPPKLKYNAPAMFDAYGQNYKPCHPATRMKLLSTIREWAQSSDGKSIFWLNGMAGTGKSTIAFTFAQELEERHAGLDAPVLGASFFFNSGDGPRASAALFLPTIVYQLQQKIPGLKQLIDEVLESTPDICTQAVPKQFDKLIREPLGKLGSSWQERMYIVVVDALDECDSENDIRDLLELWPHLFSMIRIGLRLFLTSRPESTVRLGFSELPTNTHQDVVLHKIDPEEIKHDIFIYLKDTFLGVRHQYNLEPVSGVPLPDTWPGNSILDQLAVLAAPLFIIASTICKFVQDRDCDPQQQLDIILKSRKVGYPSHMAEIYLPILQQIGRSGSDAAGRQQIYEEFQLIVGAIVVLAAPLSRKELALLLDVSPTNIYLRLRPLHSVIDVPLDVDSLIRPIHLSFGEFLVSQESSGQPFHIDSPKIHRVLIERCLEVLSQPAPMGLYMNMCGIDVQDVYQRDVRWQRISPVVSYACQHWTYHLHRSRLVLQDNDQVHQFLQLHILHWLEAMSLLSEAKNSGSCLKVVQLMAQQSIYNTKDVSIFLHDAIHFVDHNKWGLDNFPLQVYTMVTLLPSGNVIGDLFRKQLTWLESCTSKSGYPSDTDAIKKSSHHSIQSPYSPDDIDASPEFFDYCVQPTYSSDGTLLLSTAGNELRLWSTQTATTTYALRLACLFVHRALISPNNSYLAALTNSAAWLCRFDVNPICNRLESLLDTFYENATLTFSPDSLRLASAGDLKNCVRIWDTKTAGLELVLDGHHGMVCAMSYSSHGSLLASASFDKTVRLWDTTTGQTKHILSGKGATPNAVAFSSDDTLVASGYSNGIIYLWATLSGSLQHRLQIPGTENPVIGVAFLPPPLSSIVAASCRRFCSLRMWDTCTGRVTRTFLLDAPSELLSSTADGQYICMGRSSIHVAFNDSSSDKSVDMTFREALVVHDGWICLAGKKVVYLGGMQKKKIAVYGNQVAIVWLDGHVTFLRIQQPCWFDDATQLSSTMDLKDA